MNLRCENALNSQNLRSTNVTRNFARENADLPVRTSSGLSMKVTQ